MMVANLGKDLIEEAINKQNQQMSSKHEKGYMPWDRSGNRLLVKSELGANKPTNYDIPDQNFVYGKITPEDPEHSNQVMYKWKYHQPSANRNHLKEKDLIATNKHCLKNLLHTSSQFSGFRKSGTLYKTAIEGTNVVPIHLPEEDHAYGLPLELEDPVKLVIANSYGQEDKVARHTFYANQSGINSAPSRKLSCHITKNHNLLKEATAKRLEKFNWAKQDELWKLTKFRQTSYKVETRRPRTDSLK